MCGEKLYTYNYKRDVRIHKKSDPKTAPYEREERCLAFLSRFNFFGRIELCYYPINTVTFFTIFTCPSFRFQISLTDNECPFLQDVEGRLGFVLTPCLQVYKCRDVLHLSLFILFTMVDS